MNDGGLDPKLIVGGVSLLSGSGVLYWMYRIVRDDASRLQIGKLIADGGAWPRYHRAVEGVVRRAEGLFGRAFSWRALYVCVAIASFYVVLALAASELAGSGITVGGAKLLGHRLGAQGATVLLMLFFVSLGASILVTRNRASLVRWLAKWYGSGRRRIRLLVWVGIACGWLLSALLVRSVASDELFRACLVIGGLSVIGSISRITRIVAISAAFVLPWLLMLLVPTSSEVAILALICVIVTPINVAWDWLSLGVTLKLLRGLTFGRPTYGRIATHLAADVVFAVFAMVGVALTVAIAFQLFNRAADGLGAIRIQWRMFFDHGLNDPLGKGLFFSAMCVTTLAPTLIHTFAGCAALVLKPLPGSKQVVNLCLKDKLSTLEETALVGYLCITCMLWLIGSALLAIGGWVIVSRLAEPLFIGTINLVQDLI